MENMVVPLARRVRLDSAQCVNLKLNALLVRGHRGLERIVGKRVCLLLVVVRIGVPVT